MTRYRPYLIALIVVAIIAVVPGRNRDGDERARTTPSRSSETPFVTTSTTIAAQPDGDTATTTTPPGGNPAVQGPGRTQSRTGTSGTPNRPGSAPPGGSGP